MESAIYTVSPASSKPFLAAITAIISLMTAAAAMVPVTMDANSGSEVTRTELTIPVKTKETPECGSRVNPRNFCTVTGILVIFAPNLAPPYFPYYKSNHSTYQNRQKNHNRNHSKRNRTTGYRTCDKRIYRKKYNNSYDIIQHCHRDQCIRNRTGRLKFLYNR